MPQPTEIMSRRLSREEINAMPLRSWTGKVKIVRTREQWLQAEKNMREDGILGFDTETKPAFRKGKVNSPALIQIATAQIVYIVQLGWFPFGEIQAGILADPAILKVGVGISEDMRGLAGLYAFDPAGIVDLAQLAKAHNIPNQGLRTLAACLFGWRISKGSQCSNWSVRQLSPRQISYAATDAWIGRLIYLRLNELDSKVED